MTKFVNDKSSNVNILSILKSIIKPRGDVYMEVDYHIKIKTGFFKTSTYRFIVRKGLVELIPEKEGEDIISIEEGEIASMLLRKKDDLYVDFILNEGVISGTFLDVGDFQNVFKLLRENIDKNLIYEED